MIYDFTGNISFTSWLLMAIGCYALFKKDGIKTWYAFVPGLQQYKLAVMAESEEEGRTFFILVVCSYLAEFLAALFNDGSTMNVFWEFVQIALMVGALLFSVHIFLSLCDVFEKSRKWTWLWVLIPGITSIIWGYRKDFIPIHSEPDIDYSKAAAVSNSSVDSIKHGLTVNLTDKTVTEMGRKIYLLKDIHMSIPTGHMVLLLGGSGAGKTTFLNAVTGYEKANAEVVINGKNIYNNYDNMKYDLGFVPQQDLMRLSDTVYNTLSDAALLRLPKTMKRQERKERVLAVMDKLGLMSVKNSQVVKLSGGQRKRLSIAMELISDPTLFILDEPDSGLDGVMARNLFESLRAIADEGKIVIVITHTPDRVIDLFDEVIVLAKDASRTGRLAYYGPVKDSYTFFGKKSMEEILLCINQKDEGGEGRADEFVEKYAAANDNKQG